MRSSILTLQSQLEQARERLKGVEDTIKKSTGRIFTPNNTNNRQVFKRTARHIDEDEGGQTGSAPLKKRLSDVKGRLGDWVADERPGGGPVVRPGYNAQRSVVPVQGRIVTRPYSQGPTWDREHKLEESARVPARKRLDTVPGSNQPAVTVFSRLSGPPKEEDVEKIKITSQVLVQETPSRKEILAAQSKDKSCKERNRRMFGALLGTLQKFRQEESKLKEKEDKKALVERKVEEAAEREKEEAMKARRELFSSRRQEQMNIRHLEFKLTKLKQLNEWESNKSKLLPFIQTEAHPPVFYLPKKHNSKTKKLLEANQLNIQKAIEKKKAEIEKLIEDHIPPMDETKDDEMELCENLDGSAATDKESSPPLMPSLVIKQEGDTSSSDDSDSDSKRNDSDSKRKDRRHRSSSSSSSSSSDSSSKREQLIVIKMENERRTSDKENHLQTHQSPELKVKIETS